MNKKFKILMLTLTLFGGTTLSTNMSAKGLVPQTNNVFTSIGDFFGGLFHKDEVEAASLYDGEMILPDPTAAITPDTGDYAKNTAYGSDNKTVDPSIDSSTGVIEISKEVEGIVAYKTMGSTPLLTDSAGIDYSKPDATINVSLEIHNTGASDNQVVLVKDLLDDRHIDYDATDPVTLSTDPLTNDIDGDMELSIPDSSGGITLPAVAVTIGDLVSTGVAVSGVDSGEFFTLTFDIQVPPQELDAAGGSLEDYWITNTMSACIPFEKDYEYVHTNTGSGKDGVIVGPVGTVGTKLCSTALDQEAIDNNGDGEIGLSDISNLVTRKTVTDADGDNVAEAGETLTFQIS